MKYLFIDESGDHNLVYTKIDPTFKLFVLTGIVFDSKDYANFKKSWLQVKKRIFLTNKIILHSAELTRPSKSRQKELAIITNKKLRLKFYENINRVIKKHDWSLISFVIDKPKFSKLFPEYPPDPYFLSFSYILSKFAEKMNKHEVDKIFVEKRNGTLDKQFIIAWRNAYQSRIGLVTNNELKKHKISQPFMSHKSWDNSGLELADMISYRISRKFQQKDDKPRGNEIDINIIKLKKFDIAGLPHTRPI